MKPSVNASWMQQWVLGRSPTLPMLPVMINDTRQMTVLDYTSVGVLSFSIFVNVSKKANADLQLLRLKTGDIS